MTRTPARPVEEGLVRVHAHATTVPGELLAPGRRFVLYVRAFEWTAMFSANVGRRVRS